MKDDKSLILAIDQGTSGSKAIFFDLKGNMISKSVVRQNTVYPGDGFVEQDPQELLDSVLKAVTLALEDIKGKGYQQDHILCCGISNQRETFILWDSKGKPIHNAVVWQCNRSVQICRNLAEKGLDKEVRARTGLVMDPYFSGTKVAWLHQNDPAAAVAIKSGDAWFGTVDTWLLFNLTGGKSYYTDYTNASRTMFFNLKELEWDKELLKFFGLETLKLPEPVPSDFKFGTTDFNGLLTHAIPVTGMMGDSHAAAFGERCFTPGSVKITMGTGSSILMNTGSSIVESCKGMVSTICWSTSKRVDYALEGIIVSCGATMNWLQDSLKLFDSIKEADQMAESLENSGGVFIIPAFSGLGAPFWKMDMKAQISGISYGTTGKDIIRAGLESIPFQIAAIMESMKSDSGISFQNIKLDGGLTSSQLIMESIASLLQNPVERILMKEGSALGAALMAGLGYGVYSSIDELKELVYDGEIIAFSENEEIRKRYKEWLGIIASL
jgi:glycerol kinase